MKRARPASCRKRRARCSTRAFEGGRGFQFISNGYDTRRRFGGWADAEFEIARGGNADAALAPGTPSRTYWRTGRQSRNSLAIMMAGPAGMSLMLSKA